MNEIKKIHLDRQPFTIAVDAHKALRSYLEAIENQTGNDADVMKEVELRMAELLVERGVTGDGVILGEDVAYLKEQLGDPQTFKDENDVAGPIAAEGKEDKEGGPRRLYRDTDHGMIAGVSSGLGAYFNVDPLLIRLLFVAITFAGGAGIITYVLLWILVPEAKSSGERLQMRGKAVTVDNIKKFVDRADVPAAASRIGKTSARFLSTPLKALRITTGVVLTAIGSLLFTAVMIAASYTFIHGVHVNNIMIFPKGGQEVWGAIAAFTTLVLLSLSMIAIGTAVIRKRWTLPGWLIALGVGLALVSLSVAIAIGVGSAANVRERYRYEPVTSAQTTEPFRRLQLKGKDTTFVYRQGAEYKIETMYAGPFTAEEYVKPSVVDDTLRINTENFSDRLSCQTFCFTEPITLTVYIYAPALDDVSVEGARLAFEADSLNEDQDLSLTVRGGATATVRGYGARQTFIDVSKSSVSYAKFEGVRTITQRGVADTFIATDHSSTVSASESLSLKVGGRCAEYGPLVALREKPQHLEINGAVVDPNEVFQPQKTNLSDRYGCISLVQRSEGSPHR